MRTSTLLASAIFFAVTVFATSVFAGRYFIQDAEEGTITNLLYPWTQGDDCGECCVCWESALATIFAYWDDFQTNGGSGPWEDLYPCGNGDHSNVAGFAALTGELYAIAHEETGLDCAEGASNYWLSYDAEVAGEEYTNEQLGYDWDWDFDEWVWWGWDISDEIDEDRPVYFGGTPWSSSGGGHAITVVGYDDSDDRIMYLYDNHHAWLSEREYDDFDCWFDCNMRTIDIAPGGKASAPGDWTCSDGWYGSYDGCDCDCGSHDPDCDDPNQSLFGCPYPGNSTCSCDGDCECTPDCSGRECGDDGCGGTCSPGCAANEVCNDDGQCECIPDCLGRSCGDDGCGGSCGSCTDGWFCMYDWGICMCLYTCLGRECGPNGCGGECPPGCGVNEYCSLDGQCESICVSDCDDKECGSDGCGGTCGECKDPDVCQDPPGTCVCVPQCRNRECGTDPLCGMSCGRCPRGHSCNRSGQCQCFPNCGVGEDARECGPDGCGGTCGDGCEDNEICSRAGDCLCIPDCTDRKCGLDPNCGISCGRCPTNFECVLGECVCESSCDDRDCGPDGCGGTCRRCGEHATCSDEGLCVCEPFCEGRDCGDDGCGGSCGDCDTGLACIDPPGACRCIADCAGKACGDDGCGGSCGECDADETCIDPPGECQCVPDCEGRDCGPDGCDDVCGTCDDNEICAFPSGLCECVPDCEGRDCGDDGCDGSCGECDSNETCSDEGACEADSVENAEESEVDAGQGGDSDGSAEDDSAELAPDAGGTGEEEADLGFLTTEEPTSGCACNATIVAEPKAPTSALLLTICLTVFLVRRQSHA